MNTININIQDAIVKHLKEFKFPYFNIVYNISHSIKSIFT